MLAGGKVVGSTVAENAALMDRLLGAKPVAFRPSIPHLVGVRLRGQMGGRSRLMLRVPPVPVP